jgi:L-lactate permease
MNSKKKSLLLVGVPIVLLALLAFFVYAFNQDTRLHMLSHNPITIHLEILVLLVGMALVSSAGVFGLSSLWNNRPKSFVYDIGLRLVLMGDLVVFFSGLADYIGIGVHHHLPYFGPIQTAGVFLGEMLIAIGFLLMFPWSKQPQ